MTFTVRRATVADAFTLAGLNEHVHESHLRAEPTLYRATDPAELATWFATRLSDPDVVVFLAGAEQPIGFAVVVHMRAPQTPFSPPRERLLLDQIAVAASARRRGVGRALMNAAEQHARSLGLQSVQLDVRAFNVEAQRFYESLGYAPVQLRLERRLDTPPGQ